MAVAVKNTPETSSQSLLDRLPVASLVGALYVLVSLVLVFKGIPWGISWLLGQLNVPLGSFVNAALVGVAMIAAAVALVLLGLRLMGPKAPPGLRAGIFAVLAGVVVIVLVTRWIGLLLDGPLLDWLRQLFGEGARTVGAVMTVGIGLALLAWAGRAFFRPSFEKRLVDLEAQGWFSANFYKRSQGLRVRRGTMLGILILAGAGIYTMLQQNTLATAGDWVLGIPFTTAQVTVEEPGSAADLEDEDLRLERGDVVDRERLRQVNERLAGMVRVTEPNDSSFLPGELVERSALEQVREQLREENKDPPKVEATRPATAGAVQYEASITVLPDLRFTLPLLLAAAALWFAWRLVNYPVFADFLIATEAELNKVSWTTRRRLIQDTIVVLVTVILMAIFLLIVDVLWGEMLSWVGVLRKPPEQDRPAVEELQPW